MPDSISVSVCDSTRFSQVAIKPNGTLYLTGPDPQLMKGVLHTLVENHFDISPSSGKNITDGMSKTLLMGEKSHIDDFFDSWTSSNSGMKMHHVSAWGWVGGMKGAAHLFCLSAVGINQGVQVYSSSPNNINAQDKRFNGWGSGHPDICCFVFADGSTRVLNESINGTVLTAVSTRASQETIDSFE